MCLFEGKKRKGELPGESAQIMEVSSSHQLFVFAVCLGSGIALGIFFDVQRSLRKLWLAGTLRTVAEDILFAFVCIVAAIWLGFYFNRGQMRYYQIMGILSGVLFYAAFLSAATLKILAKVYFVIRKILIVPIIKTVKALVVPFRSVFSFVMRKIRRIKLFLKNAFRRIKDKRKKFEKRMKML